MASLNTKFKKLIRNYGRVFKITKKPSSYEFKSIIKITSIGLLLIGFIGFAIHLATAFIKGA